AVDIEERYVQTVIKRPAQRNLPRLTRNQFCDDGPVPRDFHVHGYVYLRLALNMNHLFAVFGLLPTLRSLVGSLRVEILDEGVGDRGADIGESPGDSLIVADN